MAVKLKDHEVEYNRETYNEAVAGALGELLGVTRVTEDGWSFEKRIRRLRTFTRLAIKIAYMRTEAARTKLSMMRARRQTPALEAV